MTTFATILDAAMELAIVPSFSRIGYHTRRALFRWTAPPADALRGQTVLITGPTSGLGRETAKVLAGLGARVILVGRDGTRLTALRDELVEATGEDRYRTVTADLSSLTSVHAAVRTILASEPRLDTLIDNAGAIHASRVESPDGIEATFATMVVGPFTLIAGVLPLLRGTGEARVISVTSGGMYAERLDLDDLGWRRRPWSGPRVYAQAKRAQVSLMREWSRRVAPSDVEFVAMHPGWADTPGISAALPGFSRLMKPILRTAAEGTDSTVWLAAHPDAVQVRGRLFLDRRPRPFDRAPHTRVTATDRLELWDSVVRLAGIPDPIPADRGPVTTPPPNRMEPPR